jgi:hypothetical protein
MAAAAAATVNKHTIIQPLSFVARSKEHFWNFVQARSFAKKKIMHAAARKQNRKIRRRRIQRRQYRKLVAEMRGESPPAPDSTLYDTYRSWMQDPIPLRLEKFMEPIAIYLTQDLLRRCPNGLHLMKIQQALWVFKIRVPHPKYPGRFTKRQWRPGKRGIHEILPLIGELERRGHVYTKMNDTGKLIVYPHASIIKDYLPQTEPLSDVLKDVIKIARIKEKLLDDNNDAETAKSMKIPDPGLSESTSGNDGLLVEDQLSSFPLLSESENDLDDDIRLAYEVDSDDEYTKESAYDIPR